MILADSFILALNTLIWHIISQENEVFDKDNLETESNSKFSNNLSQDTLEDKGKNHINIENLFFSFLKKTKSKHDKNLLFGNLNINLIRNKFESVQEIIQNNFDIFLSIETEIDSFFPSQQYSIPEYRTFRKDFSQMTYPFSFNLQIVAVKNFLSDCRKENRFLNLMKVAKSASF